MRLRSIIEDDIESLIEIRDQHKKTVLSSSRKRITEILNKRNSVHSRVMIHNSNIIAYIFLIDKFKGNKLEVHTLAVDENYINKGIGTKLMNHTIKIFNDFSFEEIDLHVMKSNERAISFYKKHNFEIVEELPNYYGKNRPALIMKIKRKVGLIEWI